MLDILGFYSDPRDKDLHFSAEGTSVSIVNEVRKLILHDERQAGKLFVRLLQRVRFRRH